MTPERRLGLGLLATGLLVAFATRATSPSPQPPLYDGVVVAEPYVWLDPPPGYPGDAQGASDSVDVIGGRNRIVAVATNELPPQAQVIAQDGTLRLAPGAKTLTVTIMPVEAPAQPADGYIDGNVYDVEVVDQDGRPATAASSAEVSIVMRSAQDALTDATIEQLDGSTWKPLKTTGGGPSAFLAVVTTFGDFAVVAHGVSPYPTVAPTAAPATPAPTAASPSATATESSEPPPTVAPQPSAAPEVGIDLAASAPSIALVVIGLIGLVVVFRRERPG